eukprot:7391570-Prymnesium_polylepis.1
MQNAPHASGTYFGTAELHEVQPEIIPSYTGVSQFGDHLPPQLPQDDPQPAIAHVAVSAWVAHTVTLRWCYYSTTENWVKLLSVLESSIHILYNQPLVGGVRPLLTSARHIVNSQLHGGSKL